MSNSAGAELSINTLRLLAVDAVQKANSGHPGAPLGCAPIAYTLFNGVMRHNPKHSKPEQLTQPMLDRITAEFKPGPKTVLSLKLLADSSAFLEPPAGELLDKAPPADRRAAGHDEIRHQFCRSHSTPYAGLPGDAPHRQLR